MKLFKRKKNTAPIEQVIVKEKLKDVAVMETQKEFNTETEEIEEPPKAKEGIKVKALSNPKYDDTLIGMLHNQFLTASDVLLEESEAFMKNRSKELQFWEQKEIENEDKAIDLKKLGFKNAGQTVQYDKERKEKEEEISQARKEIATKTELADAVRYFKTKYPAYKFITLDNIKHICKKYGLVFGENTLFTGFVPKENLEHIKNFWEWKNKKGYRKTEGGVDKSDRCFKIDNVSSMSFYNSVKTFIPYDRVYEQAILNRTSQINRDYPLHPYDGDNDWKEEIKYYFTKSEIAEMHNDSDRYDKFVQRYIQRNTSDFELFEGYEFMDELYIAAPAEDMNLEGKTVVDYEIVDAPQIDDPVVFYPVSHGENIVGGLIITAWGDEASDPLVQNESLN